MLKTTESCQGHLPAIHFYTFQFAEPALSRVCVCLGFLFLFGALDEILFGKINERLTKA